MPSYCYYLVRLPDGSVVRREGKPALHARQPEVAAEDRRAGMKVESVRVEVRRKRYFGP